MTTIRSALRERVPAAGLVTMLGLSVLQWTATRADALTVTLDVSEKTVKVLGVPYQAWTFNGTVPGPIIRVTQGTDLTIQLVNSHSETHSIHTHLHHYAIASDGSSQTAPLPVVPHQNDNALSAVYSPAKEPAVGVNPIGPYEPRKDRDVAVPGETYDYKFTTDSPGTFLYHCHVHPAIEHISRGLFGLIIVYPAGWSWTELPPSDDFGNTKAWVTGPDGKQYFEDVIMISELDMTTLQAKASVPTTGPAGKVHLANFRAWNDPYVVGPIKSGTSVRMVVANIGDEMHSWHVHAHNFDVLDKFDEQKKVLYRTDSKVLGPGESFETVFVAGKPGMWMMHDHVVPDAYAGMVPMMEVTE